MPGIVQEARRMKLPCYGAVFLWIGDSAGKADSKRKTPIDQHEMIKRIREKAS